MGYALKAFSSLDVAFAPEPEANSDSGALIAALIAAAVLITAVIYRKTKKKK